MSGSDAAKTEASGLLCDAHLEMNTPDNESSRRQPGQDDLESPDMSPEMATAIPAELNEQANIVFALSNAGFYRHFLERFLAEAGRVLHVPWWVVHLALYLATTIAFVVLLPVPRLYPSAGYVSYAAEQVGEFMFTVLMLYHLRSARTIAVLAAARISNGRARLLWMRRYLAPTSWGWVLRWRNRQWTMRVWSATAILLMVYFCGQFLFYRAQLPWLRHFRNSWDLYYPYPQLLYLYITFAKAAMMVAGAAHFWWLYGLIAIIRGRYPSSLNVGQKESLYFECGQAATRLTVVVSAATVVWVLAHALAYGFTFWAYLYSFCLLVLFTAQVIIVKGVKPYPRISARFLREMIAPDFAISWPVSGVGRFATLTAIWGPILSLGPLAQFVGALGKL